MRACLALMALAHTSSMPSSTTLSTVSTLASMSVPMPTTARSNCSAPIWRSASVSVESAATTWVKSLGELLHDLGALVDGEHVVAELHQRAGDGRAEATEADHEHRCVVPA